MTKGKNRKRKFETRLEEEKEPEAPPLSRSSDEPPPKKERWMNKQRVLVVACRGISHIHRHLMQDLRTLMPHCRPENKIERKESLTSVNEICAVKNCNKAVLFEARHHEDLYMWISNVPNGPSVKFQVENVYTMGEMKLIGNCLKASRPILSFDSTFEKFQHYALLKELFIQIFGVPNHHPKSQPFIDHVYSFSVMDNRIWFRNYQILSEDGALNEIGPRFVLNPIKIFNGSFGGDTIWANPHYVTPAMHRRQLLKQAKASKYLNKITSKVHNEILQTERGDESDFDEEKELFSGDPLEKAQEILEHEKKHAQANQQNSPKKSPILKKKKTLLNAGNKKFEERVQQLSETKHSKVNGVIGKKLKKKAHKGLIHSPGKSPVIKKKILVQAKKKARKKQKSSVVNKPKE